MAVQHREDPAWYQSVLAAVSDGVVIQDPAGRIVGCNPAAERLLGLSQAQALGRTSQDPGWGAVREDGSPFPGEDHPAMVALRTGAPVRGVVMGLQRAGGDRRWLSINAEPVLGPGGVPTAVVATFCDVTERRRVSQALAASEARLARILEAGTDGYWEADPASGQAFYSAGLNRILGLPPGGALEGPDALGARTHPEDVEPRRRLMVAVREGRQDRYEQELRIRREDGTWRWVQARGQVLARDAAGRPTRLAGVLTDVHDRKVAELARAASERRYHALVALSPGAVVVARGGQVEFVNDAALRLWGVEAQAGLVGQALAALFQSEGCPALEAAVARALAGETVRLADRQLRRLDGGVRQVEMGMASFHDDAGLALQVVVHDVTERRAVEARLEASEARFRALADEAPVGVFQTDAQGRSVYVNRAFRELLGLTGPAGEVLQWDQVVHPDDRDRVVRQWRAAAAAGLPTRTEYRLWRRDARTMVVRGDAAPLHDAGGAIAGYVGVMVDITEHRALQEQLAVNARLAAMATLVGGVAHEVNNPLAAVSAAGEWAAETLGRLKQEVRPLDASPRERLAAGLDEGLEALAEVRTGVDRIAAIVRDLRIFGRPDTERTRLRLMDVVSQALRWLPPALVERAGISVVDRGAPEVEASQGQLGQVVINLLSNAVQALPAGRRGEVEVRLGPGPPGMVRLEVADRGVGIQPEVAPRIFDPFFTTREVGQGPGLGLAVAHSIVAAHGGTLSVESQPGVGSTFRVELPAARAGAAPGPTA